MSQSTKAKIVKTAERLLWQQGYDGASLNDVVSKAGLSKGAFFHYYPSKQAMTIEVLDLYAREQILGPVEKHLSSSASVKAGLVAWLTESYGAYAQWKFKGGCLLGNFALELSDKDESLRERMKAIFLEWENMLVNYLRPAAEAGKLSMEPRQCARLIISMYEGVMMTVKVHKDANRASRDFQAMGAMIEQLIKD